MSPLHVTHLTSRWTTRLSLQPGEAPRLAWLLAYSLCTGVFTAFFFSTSLALFLGRFNAARLPYVYIAAGLVGYASVKLFTHLRRTSRPAPLVAGTLLALCALVTVFWIVLRRLDSPWTSFAMVVCISPSLTLLDLGFWSLASRLFDLHRGKRLFALVGTGEVLASILGFFLVPVLLPLLGSVVQLLPIAAAGLLLSAAAALVIGRRWGHELATGGESPLAHAGSESPPRFRDRYFQLIALSMALFVVALFLVDFSFLHEVPRYFRGSGESAAFFGVFFGGAKLGELVIKLFVSGRLLSHLGLRAGLIALPAALFASVLLLVVAGVFFGAEATVFFVLVALAKLLWLMLARSLYDPSYRMLYQPLSAEQQLAFQGGIEGTVRQASILGVGALLALFVARGMGIQVLFAVLLPALAVWMGAVLLLHRGYRARLLSALSATLAIPDRAAQSTAALQLSPADEGAVHRRIESAVETVAWDTAALLDLAEEPALAAVRTALALDCEEAHNALFQLLSQLYDAGAVELVRESLAGGSREAIVYALEILDLLLAPDLKPVVLPVLEDLPPGQRLSRLDAFAPQRRLAPVERLSALLHREQGAVSIQTRSSALAALGVLSAGTVRADLIANLFHPFPQLQEEAAAAIFRIDPSVYERSAGRLPAGEKTRLDRAIVARHGEAALLLHPRPGAE